MKRETFFIYFIFLIDSGLGNAHTLYSNSSAEIEWHIHDIATAMRLCLIPIVFLLSRIKLSIQEKAILFSYLGMQIIDVADWIYNNNTRDQSVDWAVFITIQLFILLTSLLSHNAHKESNS